jgi:hypothetical protein
MDCAYPPDVAEWTDVIRFAQFLWLFGLKTVLIDAILFSPAEVMEWQT